MNLTKEILLADLESAKQAIANAQGIVNYIQGQLAFLEKPEPETPKKEDE